MGELSNLNTHLTIDQLAGDCQHIEVKYLLSCELEILQIPC